MVEKTIQIQNVMGLHARPAARFVKVATKFPCHIELAKDDFTVDGKSILGVMSLAAEKGSKITIRATGEKEKTAIKELIKLIKRFADEKKYEKENNV